MRNSDCQSDTLDSLSELLQRLCAGGLVPAHAFVELATLLFLKMCRDERVDWYGLSNAARGDCLRVYGEIQAHLAQHPEDPELAEIFRAAPGVLLEDPQEMAALLVQINALDWSGIRALGTGTVFETFVTEALLADGSAAWRWQAPQLLADMLVGLLQPEPGDNVAVATTGCGTLAVAAEAYRQTLLYEDPLQWLRQSPSGGVYAHEPDPLSARIARMNAWLNGSHIHFKPPPQAAHILLANLPAAVGEMEQDESLATQCALLDECLDGLRAQGRAALVVGDELLYAPEALPLRQKLLRKYRLHTILRLPDGIFHGDEIQAHVLFLAHDGPTEETWFYDLRSGLPWFDPQHAPLNPRYFSPFIHAYGDQAVGTGKRRDSGAQGRFRRALRADLARQEDNLDWCWLPEDWMDPAFSVRNTPSPRFDQAFSETLTELRGLSELLGARKL